MKDSSTKSAKKRIKNPVMWFFFLAVACIVVQLFAVEYHFNKIVDFDWLKNVSVSELFHLLANNIADATILMIPFVE